jgi:methylated-DNA-[protein]-cysteine S-methyltransferase
MTMERIALGTPVGTIVALVEGRLLRALAFEETPPEPSAPRGREERAVRDRLAAYLAGELDALEAIEAEPLAGTPFQRRVWTALRDIPAGRTASYGELAARLGSGPRAVGAANGRNPIALVVPCHRVIGHDGSLVGYGGGLHRKRWLLTHEGAHFLMPSPMRTSGRRIDHHPVSGAILV